MEQKKDWVKDLIVYQVYPRSFQDSNGDGIGDIPGILSRLDHLSALGINALWLSPVFRSPNDDNGYDISGYREIMDEFGTMEDWDALCAECHKRGIKVIMDLVVNHSSDEHPWFLESKTSRDNPQKRLLHLARPEKRQGAEQLGLRFRRQRVGICTGARAVLLPSVLQKAARP